MQRALTKFIDKSVYYTSMPLYNQIKNVQPNEPCNPAKAKIAGLFSFYGMYK